MSVTIFGERQHPYKGGTGLHSQPLRKIILKNESKVSRLSRNLVGIHLYLLFVCSVLVPLPGRSFLCLPKERNQRKARLPLLGQRPKDCFIPQGILVGERTILSHSYTAVYMTCTGGRTMVRPYDCRWCIVNSQFFRPPFSGVIFLLVRFLFIREKKMNKPRAELIAL